MIDVVVSYYRADLSWLKPLLKPDMRLCIYDKNDDDPHRDPVVQSPILLMNWLISKLPNIGKNVHTYLHHIVSRWDQLADWTVFLPDDPFPHLENMPLQWLLEPVDYLVCPWLYRQRDWDDSGRIRWNHFVDRPDGSGRTYASLYADGQIQPAKLPFMSWLRRVAEIDTEKVTWVGYHPGVIWGVPRSAIRRDRNYYQKLLGAIPPFIDPEEAHYLERAWGFLFHGAIVELVASMVPDDPAYGISGDTENWWVTACEGQALAELVIGKDVLEIGSYQGISTSWLASTARHVTSVDTFLSDGVPGEEGKDTFPIFRANLKAVGLWEKVSPIRGKSADVLQGMNNRDWDFHDLIFLDGAHDYESVASDIRLSLPLLRPGGLMVFHDCGVAHPGVMQAVRELLADDKAKAIQRVRSLLVVQPA